MLSLNNHSTESVGCGRVIEVSELLLNLSESGILGVLFLYCKRTSFRAWCCWKMLVPTRIVTTVKKKKELV